MKNTVKSLAIIVLALVAGTVGVSAQMRPEYTEVWEPKPAVVTPGDPATGGAPSDAIILFGGSDLSAWVSAKDGGPAQWDVHDGILTVNKAAGDIHTKEAFGSYQLHLEWCVPPMDEAFAGQGRGNSGVYLQVGHYELQILDSYNHETYVNGQAGSVYKQTAPLVNAMLPPGRWNVFDIIYNAPQFNEDGTFRIPPRVTVLHNGVLIQNNTVIYGNTRYMGLPDVVPHGDCRIGLQAHGDRSPAVSFRNIWIRRL